MKVDNLFRYFCCVFFSKLRYGSHITIGETCSMEGMPRLVSSCGGQIRIGRHCLIDRYEAVSVGGSLAIGEYTGIGSGSSIVCRGEISIGAHCAIAPNVTIYDHNHNFGADGIEQGYQIRAVSIGNHVWIGTGVIILAGTTIGDHCVIGAGTVVHGIIPPHSLVTGSRELVIRRLENSYGKSINYYPGV